MLPIAIAWRLAPPAPAVVGRALTASSQTASVPVPQPPAGFNPLTATAAQLAAYGFPPRPSNAAALALWDNAMVHATTWEPGPAATSTPTTVTPDGAIGQERTNWAGYEANSDNNGGAQFTDALVQFTVPRVPANSHYTSYSPSDPMDAYWVGQGGVSEDGGALWQAALLAVSEQTPYYVFAYEYAPVDVKAIRITSVSITAGQTAYLEVWYTQNQGDYGHFWVENITTGHYADTPETQIEAPVYDSFECVAEWPQGKGSAYLPNFGSMTFDSCSAAENGSHYFETINGFNYIQDGDWCSNFKDRVQYPEALAAAGDFVVKYQAYNNCQ